MPPSTGHHQLSAISPPFWAQTTAGSVETVAASEAQSEEAEFVGLTEEELDELVAPVALYPDTLLIQVLVAATYPIDIIKAQRFRSQERNRQAALQRLATLLAEATHKSKKRIPTRPGRKAAQKRLDEKSRRSAIKKSRGRPGED